MNVVLEEPLNGAINRILAEMRDEYMSPHTRPWIIAFSGGKDSTLVAHLAFEMLLSTAPENRRRAVHIVSNDTLVESPAVISHLLLGVRRDESAARAQSVARYDNEGRLHAHKDLKGCLVFRPIVDLSTDDVWEFLSYVPPPWGGTHKALIQLYRDAGGGECPVVTSKDDAPSCGTSSSRFGCWTCTVIKKDRSLQGFVDAGFAEFQPLLDFRDWLVAIRDDPARRMLKKRNGKFVLSRTGTPVFGAFTLETRMEILERLLALQRQTGRQLISKEEIRLIHKIWADQVCA